MGDAITVGARSKCVHKIPLEAGQTGRWRFLVGDTLDVSFAAVFVPEAGAPIPIQDALRLPADGGRYTAATKGTVELQFDNSYSILRSKSIALRTTSRPLALEGTIEEAFASADGVYDPDTANAVALKVQNLFFVNKFKLSEDYFESKWTEAPIFALSYGTMAFLRAIMTFEPAVVAEATRRLEAAQKVCEAMMPQESALSKIGGLLRSSAVGAGIYGGLTATQLDATIVCGEVTLLVGLLYLLDESVMGFVRAGLAIRSGWNYYVTVDRALDGAVSNVVGGPPLQLAPDTPLALPGAAASGGAADAAAAPSSGGAGTAAASVSTAAVVAVHPCLSSRVAARNAANAASAAAVSAAGNASASAAAFSLRNPYVVGGVAFGMGVFNCVASILPGIATRIIAVLGFPCDREAGLEQLRSTMLEWNPRSALSACFLLVMRVLIPSFSSGDISEHLPEARAILSLGLQRYPGSALFLWMAGRLARMQGRVTVAKDLLVSCAASQTEWVQLAHLCQYELGWCHAFLHDWASVVPLFARLRAENDWSKAFFAYVEAIALLQLGRIAEARLRMRAVLRLSGRRLGGKVISAEQFAVRRAAEFLALTTIDAADAAAALGDALPVAGSTSATAAATAAAAAIFGGEDDEVSLLPASAASLPKRRLPGRLPRGSSALAVVLGWAAPLAGVELVYLFNGASQMDDAALTCAIDQVDAVLAAVASGATFDPACPVWCGTAAAAAWSPAASGAASGGIVPGGWVDRHSGAASSGGAAAADAVITCGETPDADAVAGGAAATTSTAASTSAASRTALEASAVTSALAGNAGAAVSVTGDVDDAGVSSRIEATNQLLNAAASCYSRMGAAARSRASSSSASAASVASAPATPRPVTPASTPVAGVSSASAGGGRLSVLGGFFGGWGSSSSADPADAGTPAASAASPATPSATSSAAPGSAATAYATASALHPLHTTAIAALCRGGMAAALHRVDEAAACFKWVINAHETGRDGDADAAPTLARDLHVYGYALYELAILYGNGVKALARRAAVAAGGEPLPAARAARDAALLSSMLLRGLDAKAMREQARLHAQKARDIREDFNWKMRMHLRIHLMYDELRSHPRKVKAPAGGDAGGGLVAAGAAGGAAGATGGGAGGGGGIDARGMSSADLEAALLARASAPMGSGSVAVGDPDDDELDE